MNTDTTNLLTPGAKRRNRLAEEKRKQNLGLTAKQPDLRSKDIDVAELSDEFVEVVGGRCFGVRLLTHGEVEQRRLPKSAVSTGCADW